MKGYTNSTMSFLGEIQCIGQVKKGRRYEYHRVPGKFVSSSKVLCDIPAIPSAQQFSGTLMFSNVTKMSDIKNALRKGKNVFKFNIIAPAPSLKSAQFDSNLRGVTLEFDMPASSKVSCSKMFSDATLLKFSTTKRIRCQWTSRMNLKVFLVFIPVCS